MNHQNTFWCVLCCYTSLLKHTDLNVTEFLPKISLFPEDCATWGRSQVLSNRKTIYLI